MDSTSVTNYIPILLVFMFAVAFAGALIGMPLLLARRRPRPEKSETYECGVEPVGTARDRQSVKFYLVAMIFLLFDIEAVFLVPWAVAFSGVLHDPNYRPLRFVFYGEMMLFIAILFVGLIYVWRKGILNWTRY